MSLRDASVGLAAPPPLPPGPPYACSELVGWVGADWVVPPGDPRLRRIDAGLGDPSPALANLVGYRAAWDRWPQAMDYLDAASEIHGAKLRERELYLRWWGPVLRGARRVLDVGGGIGRMGTWCADQGADVEHVDADLRSLRCALDHYAGRRGRVDFHWTTAEALPELGTFDVVIASELLNYVEDPARVMAELRRRLRPGGHLLLSVEARWGWALSLDAPPGQLAAFLAGTTVDVPGDRWVRTYDEPALRALLDGWTIDLCVPTHYVSSGPFELVAGPLEGEALHAAEDALRQHPLAGPLHRAWTVIAR